MDIYEGQRSILRLKPDYEHTLRESWDIDSPPALCKLTRLAYDFDLDSQDLVTGDTLPDTALSRLTPVRASGRFGEFLRQDAVVTYLCKAFLRELQLRQQGMRLQRGGLSLLATTTIPCWTRLNGNML